MVNSNVWKSLTASFKEQHVTLVAVSKTKPVADIQELYDLGQRDFGENYVQELSEKESQLPADIRWHYIGHLQSNKVKYIAPFVHMIHAVDSFKLLLEINKQAAKNNRTIDVLLQLFIADEETKFGLDEKEIIELLDYYDAQKADLQHIRICGLMGMASNTDNETQIRAEFDRLYNVFLNLKQSSFLGKNYFKICSMGMSSDYKIAIEAGSTMVRIGSMLFGARNYNQ
ncbi:YggS family pyridoxal phosphate-dependent enzyme [Taibaiella soli]|uniref:Pyridoxal phosphate homeostasis protein n=1 Tax=Taibaiella soli TaxID=1649169 RepID=A0A2W2AUU4_9BACT|nr:YggS family pyridoxal phosphate-dependent enzyme [Taibaiella soli]PZF71734.1 YggS family pyridoxal phosphate-dependent enzyme [Taibaiella soli]